MYRNSNRNNPSRNFKKIPILTGISRKSRILTETSKEISTKVKIPIKVKIIIKAGIPIKIHISTKDQIIM